MSRPISAKTLGSAGTTAADSTSTQDPLVDETTAPPNARRTSWRLTRRTAVVEPGRRTRVVPEGGEAIEAKALGWIAVRSGVYERADGLCRRDRLSLSDQRMGQCATQPDSEVDDGSLGSDRDADECHQMSAPGMWWTGSDGETCFTKSGPIPNRE